MAASASTLGSLIQTEVDTRMTAIQGVSPLAQDNPSFFIEKCNAIATGIASAASINFITVDNGDSGVPPVTGDGAGLGIFVDNSFFQEDMYTNARNAIISRFGTTLHETYPPSSGNSGEFLKALCDGIAQAVKDHFTTVWTLTSTHPDIYSGTGEILEGNFSGLSSSSIQSAMISAAPNLQGIYWPDLVKVISDSYVETIHNHSTGTVTITGTCIPSTSQVCAVPSSGAGIGVAT